MCIRKNAWIGCIQNKGLSNETAPIYFQILIEVVELLIHAQIRLLIPIVMTLKAVARGFRHLIIQLFSAGGAESVQLGKEFCQIILAHTIGYRIQITLQMLKRDRINLLTVWSERYTDTAMVGGIQGADNIVFSFESSENLGNCLWRDRCLFD